MCRREVFALAVAAAAVTVPFSVAVDVAPETLGSAPLAEARAASATAGLAGWAARGHLDKVKMLLGQRADVQFDNDYGSTALHVASLKGHAAVAELLLGQRAGVDAADVHGLRPLHWAALHGKAAVVETLLAARAAPGSPADEQLQQPLHLAARTGATDVVEMLLAAGAPADEKDDEGCTPLLWAAFSGHSACGSLLLHHGADVAARDSLGETALHWAARGHLETVRVLLDFAASPDQRSADGRTPASWAEHEGRGGILALLGAEAAERGSPAVIADGRRRTSKPWFIDVDL